MSAPAALAMAKLSFPETQISQTKTEQDVYMEKTLVELLMFYNLIYMISKLMIRY